MEIKIISSSTKIIKPSSPTPKHLRTHKLFFPNHIMPNIYFPFTFFYSSPMENNSSIKNISDHLKNSLSKVLTYYYPFAGQNIDGVSTECNDHGATFIETQVANELANVLQNKDKAKALLNIKELLPFNGQLPEIPETTCHHPNLFVQVNYFRCGGIAITIFLSHRVSDATTAANFVKSWGEVARGADELKNVIVEYSSIYPPYEAIVSSFSQPNRFLPSELVTKIFTFDAKSIVALKEKMGNGLHLDRPTRFEAISTLILDSIINITRETAKQGDELAAVTPMDLRNKINPPLPPQCMGNLITMAITKFSLDNKIDSNNLAGKLHETLRKIVDQYKTNVHLHDAHEHDGLSNCSKFFHITDLSKLPFYEADFGWGKPKWVVLPALSDNLAILMRSYDGKGVEAWIGLTKEEMDKFEKLSNILAFTQSSNQLFMSKRARL